MWLGDLIYLGFSFYETLGTLGFLEGTQETLEGHKKCKFDGKEIQKSEKIYVYIYIWFTLLYSRN